MQLAELVATADAVASTSSRNAKIQAIAEFLAKLPADEIVPAAGFLSGETVQGKIGVGWARLSSIDVPHAKRPSVTIHELDETLAEVQRTVGSGSSEVRSKLLSEFLRRSTAREANFVRRLLVGELRHGALEGLMIEAIARAAEVPSTSVRRAMMLSGDLRETAKIALTEGEKGLSAVGLEVLRPIRPMLASTSEDLAEAMSGIDLASVEWKLDGLRIQVHRKGREVRVFTRNLNDITQGVSGVVEIAKSLPANQVVLDGEAILLDDSGLPRAFEDTMSDLDLPLTPFFFDCLHVDGRDLIDLPLVERLENLSKVVGDREIPSIVTSELSEAERVMKDALEAGHEGVMVKAIGSTYQAGRRGKAWKKVKPVRTLDLVVLGAEWGHGRRRGWLSNLHLGARDRDGGFVMVGKTFKGMTDELLRWQTEKLQELETEREGITVFVRPELIVEIELDGVQRSPRYPGGVALRFARVLRYRPDKDPSEADTIDTVRSIMEARHSLPPPGRRERDPKAASP